MGKLNNTEIKKIEKYVDNLEGRIYCTGGFKKILEEVIGVHPGKKAVSYFKHVYGNVIIREKIEKTLIDRPYRRHLSKELVDILNINIKHEGEISFVLLNNRIIDDIGRDRLNDFVIVRIMKGGSQRKTIKYSPLCAEGARQERETGKSYCYDSQCKSRRTTSHKKLCPIDIYELEDKEGTKE